MWLGRLRAGYDLRIGWGKSVPLPAHPIWPPPGGEACLPGADLNKPMTPAEVAAAAAAEIGRRTGYSTESTILPTVVKREADPRLLALQQLPPNGPDIIVRCSAAVATEIFYLKDFGFDCHRLHTTVARPQ